jgi:hypothetical protein
MSEEDAPAQEAETAPVETPNDAEAPEAEAESKQFDEGYVKKLRAEAAKYRTEAQEAKAKAQEYEDAQKTELEKAQDRLTQTETAKAEAEAKLLRYEVAAEKNVPANLLELLVGGSKEELEQKADLILENVKPAEAPQATFDGGPREPAPEPKTPDQAHNDLVIGLLGKTNQ